MTVADRAGRVNDPGWDDLGRQQCRICWKWQFPAIHSCPGVPQVGAVPPPDDTGPPGEPAGVRQWFGRAASGHCADIDGNLRHEPGTCCHGQCCGYFTYTEDGQR